MNYRHAFHAGNFADLIKHAALTLCLEAMTKAPARLTVIDTHAGAGVYDLGSDAARRSGEAAQGILRLMGEDAAPEAFDTLVAAVARMNPGEEVRIYPGSPALICAGLRADDRLIACELRPDEHRLLAEFLEPMAPQARALEADGFRTAVAQTPAREQVLVHIDPPFERREDDYRQIVMTCQGVLARNPAAVILVWLPLKDLETFDGFLRLLEGVPSPVLIAETRLRPLDDPMLFNGCALALLNPPQGVEAPLGQACDWLGRTLGTTGAEGRIWRL